MAEWNKRGRTALAPAGLEPGPSEQLTAISAINIHKTVTKEVYCLYSIHPRTAAYWIERLHLTRHPEGGWFRETYRAAEAIPEAGLPARFQGERVFSTAIQFLLERDDCSALHRLKSDEMWHFYDGAPL